MKNTITLEYWKHEERFSFGTAKGGYAVKFVEHEGYCSYAIYQSWDDMQVLHSELSVSGKLGVRLAQKLLKAYLAKN